MKELLVDPNGVGKRLDKYLTHVLSGAPKPLLYAQLRKKNITLNGRRAAGNELLSEGDRVQCFFSDETWEKFLHPAFRVHGGEDAHPVSGGAGGSGDTLRSEADRSFAELMEAAEACFRRHPEISVLYEDPDLLIVDKPAGLLSQRAGQSDESLNDWVLGYLLSTGAVTVRDLGVFRPGICHRLDRNTSGIVICAVSLAAAQAVSRMLRDRTVGKYYLAAVHGEMKKERELTGALVKDRAANRSRVTDKGMAVRAFIRPLGYLSDADATMVEAELITGKPHQLRAQLASIGHPIVGDRKYGGSVTASDEKRFGAKWQLLHCARITFPGTEGALSGLSGRTFISEAPFADRFPDLRSRKERK
ncbi:MAG: RluA family pseudouridine synthase [Lachnospiraceae bacterium]|nr:RluA family pseudouridine synthase [Lachnospiraceae bacterium]